MAIPTRRATVEHLGDNRIRLTCRDCGHKWTKTKKFIDGRPWTTGALAFMVSYWNQNGGCITKCPACMKRRDERHRRR